MIRYGWARRGDINAFFGLMLDTLAVMFILVRLVTADDLGKQQDPENPRFSTQFVLTRMIPATPLRLLIGDLVYTWLAFRLAPRSAHPTEPPLPLDLARPSALHVDA